MTGRKDKERQALLSSSVIAAAEQQLSTDLAGEAVILNIDSGTYYSLEGVGAKIWSLIQEPRTVMEIKESLLASYEVDPARCERDLFDLLQELCAAGLIEVRNETAR